ncbi:MAG: PEP-CTERM sorting domain-containing protein [Pirellulales bacterium]
MVRRRGMVIGGDYRDCVKRLYEMNQCVTTDVCTMKATQSASLVLVIAALVAPSVSAADLVTYSGAGEVGLNSGQPDPWGIGDSKQFIFRITVAGDAVDSSSSVDRARYEIVSAAVSIDGTSTNAMPSGPIQFIDNIYLYADINSNSDEVLATLNVTLNGYTQPLTIVQYFDPSTFSFVDDFESLPVINTNTRYDGPTVSSYDYATFFPAKLAFESAMIPEPSTVFLVSVGLGLFAVRRQA